MLKGKTMGLHYEQIINDRLGERDGGVLLRTFDRQGWAIVNKGELLALRRAAARLEKQNGSTNGKKPKTTAKGTPLAAAEKIRRVNPARAERLKAETTNKRAVRRRG